MAIVPYTSTNQAGATIFFQRHSQSGEGDDAADAVIGVVGIVDSTGSEIGSSNPLPISLPSQRVFKAALTLDTSPYASGDTLADLLEITNAVRTAGGTGTITSVTINDLDGQAQGLDLIFFDQSVTLSANNNTWNTAMVNVLHSVAVEAADYKTYGSDSSATIGGLSLAIQPNSGTSIYIGAISRGTGTYTVNGLEIVIGILRD